METLILRPHTKGSTNTHTNTDTDTSANTKTNTDISISTSANAARAASLVRRTPLPPGMSLAERKQNPDVRRSAF